MKLLQDVSDEWSFMGDQAKIDRAALGTNWVKSLESIVRKIQLPE